MARSVGVYRTVFGLPSEAFLAEQIAALKRYRPLILARMQCGPAPADILALRDAPLGYLRERAFAATRNARLFGAGGRLRDLSLIHAHFGPDGVFGLAIAQHLRVPLMVTFHGFDATMTRSALWATRKWYVVQFLLREQQLRSGAARFIAISKFIAARLVERGYPADKIIQHYIGVDTQKFTPQPHKSVRYVFSAARIVPKKGLDTLIRAFAKIAGRHPDVGLVHVGGGPQLEALRDLATALGVGHRVRFRGACAHDEIVALMQGAEVFALPSRTASDGDAEGLGIVFNEASACAIPIVSTWHGGIPEAVLHGETGLLAPENDVDVLASHLDAILADRALGERMGLRGREYACDVFDIRTQTARLEEVYDQLVS